MWFHPHDSCPAPKFLTLWSGCHKSEPLIPNIEDTPNLGGMPQNPFPPKPLFPPFLKWGWGVSRLTCLTGVRVN